MGISTTTGGLLIILGLGAKGLANSKKTRIKAGTTIIRTKFFTFFESERVVLDFCLRFFNRLIPGLPFKVCSLSAFFRLSAIRLKCRPLSTSHGNGKQYWLPA